MNILADSNIIIDYLAHRDPFYESARKLMIFSAMGDYNLWVSASQVTDILFVLSRNKKISFEENKSRVLSLFEKIHICSVDEEDVKAALESPWPDTEDALVHRIALKTNSEAIITRNKKDFSSSFVKVFDCDSFFKWAKETKRIEYEEIPF